MRPYRRQPTRLPRPWDSPGKNTGVGCHFLLQCVKVKSESEVTQSCPTLSDPMDCSPPGSSIHGIFQARVLEWGAIVFSEYCSTHPQHFPPSFFTIPPCSAPRGGTATQRHASGWCSPSTKTLWQREEGEQGRCTQRKEERRIYLPLKFSGWTSLQSKGLSRVFSNTTIQKHQFFGTQPSSQSNSHIHT